MGGKDAPESDPMIGKAAMKSAETGANHLAWMQEQAKITNKWADEDRTRYKTVFEPLQDDYIAKAKAWDTPERQAEMAAKASADVKNQLTLAEDQRKRSMMAAGVDPSSGRYAGVERGADVAGALAVAGAENNARENVRRTAMELQGNAINLGSGLGVNPLSSISTSNQAASSGANAAIQGYGQQANILGQEWSRKMAAYQQQQANSASLLGSLGGVVGLAFGSDEEIKEDKRPARGLLDAVEDMRVDEWSYKDGEGDGGRHIGTYAQDFKRATGKGDGKTINVIDAIGVTMGAVKELSEKVDDLTDMVTNDENPAKRALPAPMRKPRGLMPDEGVAA